MHVKMKKVAILLFLSFLIFSCEKESFVPASEIPDWLNDRIALDEIEIESGDRPDLKMGEWIRFKYLDNNYYEYHNPLSSSMYNIYDWNGNLHPFNQEDLSKYTNEKCCKKYVWRGSFYFKDN
jgi:hypothetical protein